MMLRTCKHKLIFAAICCCFVLSSLHATWIFAQEQAIPDSPPVIKLKELYDKNKQFHDDMEAAFNNLQDMPKDYKFGGKNYWKKDNRNNFNYLCQFFNKWSYFAPTTEDGLTAFIEPFYQFFYKNDPAIRLITGDPGLRWTKDFVNWRKSYMESQESLWTLDRWKNDPSWNDYIIPEGGFKSFNALFTRRIKPGLRPVADPRDPSVLISPADSLLNRVKNRLAEDDKIPTKGRQELSIKKLLADSKFYSRFVGGSGLSFVLMPINYHCWHAPVTGYVVESRESVMGRFFGNPDFPDFFRNGNVGYDSEFSIFEVYHRGYYIFKTARYGYVAMIPVGLDDISSITFEPKFKDISEPKKVAVQKGDIMGHFAYGGSMIILLFEKGVLPSDIKTSRDLLQGQRVAKLKRISNQHGGQDKE